MLEWIVIDGDKVPDLYYEALEKGIAKYPILEGYIQDMTSDIHYSLYSRTESEIECRQA